MVTDRKSYDERFTSTDELMGLMGYQPGALKQGTSDKEKEKMMRDAFHYQFIRALAVREQSATAHVYKVEEIQKTYGPSEHASDEENRLHTMNVEQLEA